MDYIQVCGIVGLACSVPIGIACFLFRLLTGDWWQYRDTRRREFKEYTTGEHIFFKAFNWAFDLWEKF